MSRDSLAQFQRWVIKIGSALLTADGQDLDHDKMALWVDQVAALRAQGREVVLVSSGAVAAGMCRLGLAARPETLHGVQAAAAVGQMGLVQAWESQCQRHNLHTAQVLLTHDDLSDRTRYLNARSTLLTLLDMGVIPVINENDTVVTDEIRFGDNDTLAALAANLVQADVLLILTDANGLFDQDPRDNPDAQLIEQADANDERLMKVAGGSKSGLGRGGMVTKVRAAQLAARSGTPTVIVGGREELVISRVAAGESLGTLLLPEQSSVVARKQWLAGHLQMKGVLVLDEGAVQVLRRQGSSLLPVGVSAVRGSFSRGEMVSCVGPDGVEVARGLVNYDADEAGRIVGVRSDQVVGVLGYINEEELVHRDNLVLL